MVALRHDAFIPPKLPVEELELDLLLEGIHRQYGFDFRQYSRASLRRRIDQFLESERAESISALQGLLLRDSQAVARLVTTISIPSTAMFRDPQFYRSLRERIAPLLRELPLVRIWHAGCATGEEVYSTAILLREEGLLDRAKIYATDMNEAALRQAKRGIFPLYKMQEYSRNYQLAAGTGSFSEYYTASAEHALFDRTLATNVVWAAHNLATDASFNEFHVVMCRNVLIYFTPELQTRVHGLLHGSLTSSGFLILGAQESLELTGFERRYAPVQDRATIYRKVA